MRSHGVDVAIFAIAFALAGLVALALVWSGDWAYAMLASATGNTHATFVAPPEARDVCGPELAMDLSRLLEWHRHWVAYVIGIAGVPPGPACSLFSSDEYRHMADVRNVFTGAELIGGLAAVIAAYRVWRGRRRGAALRVVRDGALLAAGLVAIVGVVAVLAFEPLFLLFHQVFFPQGNFLFDPATSNLVRLYPEWYWQGITAGVGVSFIALALVAAAGAQVALRRASTTYTRAA
ncbi:MAG TPA: DUF1461 domain-containing protein [Candidatus Limnocylindria bacterium]|nr:DUF1461 domain-containing protein [Candidatus Limnocylindria bacterium]